MTLEFKGIPITVSGEKYRTAQGYKAIRDGIKKTATIVHRPRLPKPAWLRVRHQQDARFIATQDIVQKHGLATVCEESHCPNISECWSHGTATLMLMGAVCTRACRFCAVDTGNPNGWLDAAEPQNAANAVRLMKLDYVVLTSVDRDDLADGGASHYAKCIQAIRAMNPYTTVEALTPDFSGDRNAVRVVVQSGIGVFAQNLETVRALTHQVRDPRAGYDQTLDVLAIAKSYRRRLLTKTSLMLGLGETDEQIRQALRDARNAGVDIVTLGQYLQPTANHLPVARYVTPDEFTNYRQIGLAMGFHEVVAGPLVRSSYRADQVFNKNNVGLA